MELITKGFPQIMRDNDVLYLQNLYAVIESVDEYSSMEIINTAENIHFRIAPSEPKYSQSILKEILKLNNMYGIQLELGKSIRTSSTITFNINLNN